MRRTITVSLFLKRHFDLKIEYVQTLEKTRKANEEGQTNIRLKLNR